MRTISLNFLRKGVSDYELREDGVILDEWGDIVPLNSAGYIKLCPPRKSPFYMTPEEIVDRALKYGYKEMLFNAKEALRRSK